MSRRALLAAGAGLALTAAGCLSTTQRREDNLVREARTFNDDFRWARWEALTAAMPKEDGKLFLGRVGEVGDELVLADYEVTSITFVQGSEAATVVVRFDWYMKSQMRLRSTTLEQRWEWKEGRWLAVKHRRTRGDRFPLVTEPIAASGAEPAAAGTEGGKAATAP